jgi:pimeloyl-ACP methyl ester carboxylesterase
VYAPDFPGFGKSEKPRHILEIPELADVLAAYMDAVGLERAVLVANSMGCQITADFALRYPDRLLRAVFIGPTMDRYARTRWRQFWRLMLDALREPISQPFVVFGDYLRTGARRTLRTAKLAIEDKIEQKLPHMRVPTLVVRGGRDPIVSQRWAEDVTNLLPNARLVVFPKDAHTVHYSAPAELVRLLRPFVDQARKASSPGRRPSLLHRTGRLILGSITRRTL